MKKIILLTFTFFLIIFSIYLFISASPQYTFYLIYKSIKNHDAESFYRYVDVDSIIDNFISDTWKNVAQMDGAQNEWSTLNEGIAQAMKPVAKSMLTQIVKQEITKEVENIEQPSTSDTSSEETPIKGFIERFKSFKNLPKIKIKRSGKVAVAKVASHKKEEQAFIIRMRQMPQRYWKIATIKIPSLEKIDAQAEKQEGQAENNTSVTDPEYIQYYRYLRERVNRNVYDNYDGRGTGRIVLIFTVLNTGELKNVDVDKTKSSLDSNLIATAIKSIKQASPFPLFPEVLRGYPELDFNLTIDFNIESENLRSP